MSVALERDRLFHLQVQVIEGGSNKAATSLMLGDREPIFNLDQLTNLWIGQVWRTCSEFRGEAKARFICNSPARRLVCIGQLRLFFSVSIKKWSPKSFRKREGLSHVGHPN